IGAPPSVSLGPEDAPSCGVLFATHEHNSATQARCSAAAWTRRARTSNSPRKRAEDTRRARGRRALRRHESTYSPPARRPIAKIVGETQSRAPLDSENDVELYTSPWVSGTRAPAYFGPISSELFLQDDQVEDRSAAWTKAERELLE